MPEPHMVKAVGGDYMRVARDTCPRGVGCIHPNKESKSMKRSIFLLTALLVLGTAGVSFAQGALTGTIRGVTKDQTDLPVPGVKVTAQSSTLQGRRTTISDATGNFVLRQLPAGTYTITFELVGFAPIQQTSVLPLGGTLEQNVTMQPGAVTENVSVVAETPAPIATPTA